MKRTYCFICVLFFVFLNSVNVFAESDTLSVSSIDIGSIELKLGGDYHKAISYVTSGHDLSGKREHRSAAFQVRLQESRRENITNKKVQIRLIIGDSSKEYLLTTGEVLIIPFFELDALIASFGKTVTKINNSLYKLQRSNYLQIYLQSLSKDGTSAHFVFKMITKK